MADTPSPRKVIPVIPIQAAPAHSHAHGSGHDHDHGHGHDHGHAHHHHEHDDCCGADAHHLAPIQPVAEQAPPPDAAHVRFRIDQMDCPTEERLIRKHLESMAGVVRLDFNLLERELTVHHQLDDIASVERALMGLGMAPRLLAQGERTTPPGPALPTRTRWMLAAAGLCAVAAEATAWITGEEDSWLIALFAVLSLVLAGGPTLRKGWIALKHFTLNIYFLMTLAVVGAVLIGRWSEAAMVVFLFALAEAIEALSLERARHAVQALSAYAPDTAWVLGDTGEWASAAVQTLTPGQRIRVRAGERVPLDARVVDGHGAVDQAPITGESLPVDKQIGDELYAGTILTDGLLEAEVTATAARSTMARMAEAIQQAQSQRAPTQRFVDQFARYYTPIVVAIALAVALLGPWVTGDPWQTWLYQALVMLVIACPCALVVSTPVTVVSGLAAAARLGMLIKGGIFLETGRRLKAVALDKTGTLTQGRPALTDVLPGAGWTDTDALHLAASLDAASTHPVARAVVQGWQRRPEAAQRPLLAVEDFQLIAGRGVSGRVRHSDGSTMALTLGNPAAFHGRGVLSDEMAARIDALAGQGKTVFALVHDDTLLGLLAVADTVRPQSADAVKRLAAQGVSAVMLTGDNAEAARHIAQQVGITDVRAPLMPTDKLQAIEVLQARYGKVAMVGDGVNDAPALARADIGLAMGAAGTATALETADVAIMDDDPRKIARFIALSHTTHRVLVQNIVLALGIKAVFMALSLAGLATLWMAVFADVGASLLVVANGLRLLREAKRH